MVEGARLESVYRGNSIEGSNPSLSARTKSTTYTNSLGSTPLMGQCRPCPKFERFCVMTAAPFCRRGRSTRLGAGTSGDTERTAWEEAKAAVFPATPVSCCHGRELQRPDRCSGRPGYRRGNAVTGLASRCESFEYRETFSAVPPETNPLWAQSHIDHTSSSAPDRRR